MEKDLLRAKEIEIKISQVRQIIEKQNLKGILLNQQYNLYWLTAGGNNHVLWDEQFAIVGILITKDKAIVLGENGDIFRVRDEEFFNYDFEYIKYDWYASSQPAESLKIAGKGKFGTDFYDPSFTEQLNINPFLSEFRSAFQTYEAKRYIEHGKEAACIITDVCRQAKPGMRENEIAAMFASECIKKGFTIFVQLLGSDERSLKYRHQVVTDKKIEKHFSFCGVGRYQGFTYPINRVVSFGEPEKFIKENNKKTETVYALLNENAKIGTNLNEIYKKLPEIYASAGIDANEWKNHSIGGTTGYLPRENQLLDGVDYVIRENNMIGWNPSLPGSMSEDVYMVKKDNLEFVTWDERWPIQRIKSGTSTVIRPAMLIL